MIEVRNLTKRFGSFTAVDRIHFFVRKGEILGFLGPNGAGKTTTIKMILGLVLPTSGEILIKGKEGGRLRRDIKKCVGYMSQQFSLYPLLTAVENVEFSGGVSGLPRKRIREKVGELSREIPASYLHQQVRDVPPGIRQRISLFVSLMNDPEILFLDEPTSGVDPETRRGFWNTIYGLRRHGKTVLVTTHNLDEAEYADRIIILHRGRIVLEGEPRHLLQERGAQTVEELFREAVEDHEAA